MTGWKYHLPLGGPRILRHSTVVWLAAVIPHLASLQCLHCLCTTKYRGSYNATAVSHWSSGKPLTNDLRKYAIYENMTNAFHYFFIKSIIKHDSFNHFSPNKTVTMLELANCKLRLYLSLQTASCIGSLEAPFSIIL